MNNIFFLKLITILFNSTTVSFNSKFISQHNYNSTNLSKKILKNIKYKTQKITSLYLDSLIDEYLNYCNYTNKEYYKAGFKDALNLILPAIFKDYN